jgi:hypothetical protein
MERTRKPTKKNRPVASEAKIKAAYVTQLLTNGARPASVYKFCLDLGIREDEFYSFFGSFEGIEKSIWNGFIKVTINRLQSDESFGQFSAREKVLSLYFTLLEELRANRSFVLLQLNQVNRLELTPVFLRDFRKSYEEFVELILAQGKENGEVATRPLLDDQYPQLFWLHMGFILTFWCKDDSAGFEKTDAAIEKSVNLAFDLVGKGAVDSALDFGKFLYQNK